MSSVFTSKSIDNTSIQEVIEEYEHDTLVAEEVCIGDGSDVAPSLKFNSDPTSGLYSEGIHTVAFSTNGVKRFKLNDTVAELSTNLCGPAEFTIDDAGGGESIVLQDASTRIRLRAGGATRMQVTDTLINSSVPIQSSNAGTAAFPDYSFTGNGTTGMYRSAADEVAFSTAGLERFKIANTVATLSTDLCGPSEFTIDNDAGGESIALQNASSRIRLRAGGVTRLMVQDTLIDSSVPIRSSNAGGVDAPDFSFVGDEDTGVYRVGGNNLGVSVGAVKKIDVNGSRVDFTDGISIGGGSILNNFTEGTYSPTLGDGTNEVSYVFRTGAYMRIRNRIFINVQVEWSGLGSVSGVLQVSLPFANRSGQQSNLMCYSENVNWTPGDSLSAEISGTDTYATLRSYGPTGSKTLTDLDNPLGMGNLIIVGHYPI
jgi:hypothetical protein